MGVADLDAPHHFDGLVHVLVRELAAGSFRRPKSEIRSTPTFCRSASAKNFRNSVICVSNAVGFWKHAARLFATRHSRPDCLASRGASAASGADDYLVPQPFELPEQRSRCHTVCRLGGPRPPLRVWSCDDACARHRFGEPHLTRTRRLDYSSHTWSCARLAGSFVLARDFAPAKPPWPPRSP